MAGVLAGSNQISCPRVGVVAFPTCTPCLPQIQPNCAMHCFWKELKSGAGAHAYLACSLHPDHRGSPLTPHPGLYMEWGKKTLLLRYLNETL